MTSWTGVPPAFLWGSVTLAINPRGGFLADARWIEAAGQDVISASVHARLLEGDQVPRLFDGQDAGVLAPLVGADHARVTIREVQQIEQ